MDILQIVMTITDIVSNLNHVNPLQTLTGINLGGLNPYLQNAT